MAALREQESEANYEQRLKYLNEQVKSYESRVDSMQDKLNHYEGQ